MISHECLEPTPSEGGSDTCCCDGVGLGNVTHVKLTQLFNKCSLKDRPDFQ